MLSVRGFMLLAALLAANVPVPCAAQGPEKPANAIEIVVGKGKIDFKVAGTLVTTYVTAPEAPKPYFYPLNSPPGVPITRAWPIVKDLPGESKDHPHHKSAWFCHGDVIPEGIEFKQHIKGVVGVDFWSEHAGHGRIVCVRVGAPTVKGDHAWVETVNEWRTAEGVVILREVRTIHLYRLGAGANLIVMDSVLHADLCGITFGDTKEGSFAVRVLDAIRSDKMGKGTLTNAEGKVGMGVRENAEKKGCWGLVSAWCDYSGPAGPKGEVAGIALFAGPRNKIDTAWHARDYGLLAANPFGMARSRFPDRKGKTELVKLKKGEKLDLRYAILLHAGDAKEGKVAEHYATFAKMP